MKKPLHSCFDETYRRFLKLKRRYDRQVNSGEFHLFPKLEQSRILKKLYKLVQQLIGMKDSLGKFAAAAAFTGLMSFGATAQNFVEVTGSGNPMNSFSFCGDAHPVFVDIDNDGDQDCFVNYYSVLNHYENTGTSSAPVFVDGPLDVTSVNGSIVNAEFVDIDDDNDFDIVIADEAAGYYFWEYENTGSVSAASFTIPGGSTNAMGYHCGNAQPAFADLDNDGDEDIVFGTLLLNEIVVNINTGTAAVDNWGSQSTLISTGLWGSPELYDFDGDNDYDLFVGNVDGTIDYYENQGTVTSYNFVQQTGSNNPFDGIDVGDYAYPVLVNIDGDPDPEAFVGDQSGSLVRFFDIPGGVASPVAAFTSSATSICPTDCVVFSDNSTDATSWAWTFPSGSPGTSNVQTPPTICWSAAGSYDVQLIVNNVSGADTMVTTITVDSCAAPTAAMTPGDSTICRTECVTYSDNSTDATSWVWTFDGGTPATSNSATPGQVCWDTPGTYDVELIVNNSFGADTTTSTVTVNNCDLNVGEVVFQSFEIYPNPATDQIVLNVFDEIINVQIFDGAGRLIIQKNALTGLNKLSLSELSSGAYHIRMFNENAVRVERLIVK